jgi:hypothetical protein
MKTTAPPENEKTGAVEKSRPRWEPKNKNRCSSRPITPSRSFGQLKRQLSKHVLVKARR